MLLEELGADVNVRDHEGWTPLHAAARFGLVELARYCPLLPRPRPRHPPRPTHPTVNPRSPHARSCTALHYTAVHSTALHFNSFTDALVCRLCCTELALVRHMHCALYCTRTFIVLRIAD